MGGNGRNQGGGFWIWAKGGNGRIVTASEHLLDARILKAAFELMVWLFKMN